MEQVYPQRRDAVFRGRLWLTQVLIDGSFKHFKRICEMLLIRYENTGLEPINIERWAQTCLNNKGNESCC